MVCQIMTNALVSIIMVPFLVPICKKRDMPGSSSLCVLSRRVVRFHSLSQFIIVPEKSNTGVVNYLRNAGLFHSL